MNVKPELRNGNGERTRPACQFGRRARTRVPHNSDRSRREAVCRTRCSARRCKPPAGGVVSPELAIASATDFGIRVKTNTTNSGAVVSVRGSVVDSRFDGQLPPICSVLRAGAKHAIAIEVLAQRDVRHVRWIALAPTQGFAREGSFGLLPHRPSNPPSLSRDSF
jgi:hypothetical protein